jgi:hypothetical protein
LDDNLRDEHNCQVLKCRHKFHAMCLDGWLKSTALAKPCPVCPMTSQQRPTQRERKTVD